ncbi:MAG: hypothetical protein USCAAHI_00673 [Beijerinckiaceae bacterium]|nr:MAG: hypothetical protein USCAAHI_00673 [Beijerinckiaceae bacterium]
MAVREYRLSVIHQVKVQCAPPTLHQNVNHLVEGGTG